MNNIEAEIRNNLYEFYDLIARIDEIFSEKQDHWSTVNAIPGAWPRVIYKIDEGIIEQQSATIFSEKVTSKQYPELLIASDEMIREVDPFLRQHGFYPFSAWKGMAIRNPEVIIFPNLPETIQIVRPESDEEMEQWLEIVSTELVAPAMMDKTLLERLITQPGIGVFLLKFEGKGVSTILTFTSENSTGLYLIATEKMAQRKGFAKLLVQQILVQEARKSKKPIVLHATPKGEILYLNLGFSPFNQFFLYRYLSTTK